MSNEKKRKLDDSTMSTVDVIKRRKETDDMVSCLNERKKEWGCAWFVCHGCCVLIINTCPDYLPTTDSGDNRPFCALCVNHCNECDELYCDSMDYKHEDCEQGESEDSKSDE